VSSPQGVSLAGNAGGVWTSDMQLAPMMVNRDVPAPTVVAHCYVIDREQLEWTRAFNVIVKLDIERIDQAVLALLGLGLHDGTRAWKSFDWEVMARLHEKGFISDPHSKAQSVAFTEEGLAASEQLLRDLFGERPE
jgi:hypothetical protein